MAGRHFDPLGDEGGAGIDDAPVAPGANLEFSNIIANGTPAPGYGVHCPPLPSVLMQTAANSVLAAMLGRRARSGQRHKRTRFSWDANLWFSVCALLELRRKAQGALPGHVRAGVGAETTAVPPVAGEIAVGVAIGHKECRIRCRSPQPATLRTQVECRPVAKGGVQMTAGRGVAGRHIVPLLAACNRLLRK